MEDKKIPDDQITASSVWSGASDPRDHGASNARLNRPAQGQTTGSWSALTKDLNQWIQVNFLLPTWVTGVMTQGREGGNQWVTEYKVEYSSDGQNWIFVRSIDNQEETVSSSKCLCNQLNQSNQQ